MFYFVLPPPVTDDDEADASDASDAEAHAASVSTLSSAEEDTETPAETQPKLVLKPRSRLETAKGKKRSHEPEALSNAAASDETKRQRTVDAAPVQPGASRSPPVDAEARSGGKGKGKSAKTKVEADDTLADDAAPLSALANAATHATGPVFQKPDLSNVQLITNALSSESCARKGSKLTLQEVYEWLQNTYPWFSQNGRKTGRDWQSSIRHTIGTCREFVKIPRRPDEPGKGIFYTLSTSELAKAQEAARHEAPSAVHDTPAAPLPAATHSSTPASASTAAAAAATAATPKSAGTTKVMPRIPLVVGVPPNADAVVPRSKGAPGSIESLLDTPPIAHHQGRLYLSPTVFGHLKPEQLSQIEALGAQQALQVLQSYLVTHLKERMKKTSAAPTATTTASPAAMKPMPSAPPATTPAATPPAASSAASAPRPGVYDQRLEAPKVPRIPVATTPSQPAPLPSASPSVAKSSSTPERRRRRLRHLPCLLSLTRSRHEQPQAPVRHARPVYPLWRQEAALHQLPALTHRRSLTTRSRRFQCSPRIPRRQGLLRCSRSSRRAAVAPSSLHQGSSSCSNWQIDLLCRRRRRRRRHPSRALAHRVCRRRYVKGYFWQCQGSTASRR